MKIFLDTADISQIERFNDMGLLDGITTNPSLLYKAGTNPDDTMRRIVQTVQGDISLEVVSTTYADMIREGNQLAKIGPNVVIKVPMTHDGLQACRTLSSAGTPVNVTLIFSPNQALLAAKAGARYVSPFIGRLDDIGHDGMALVRTILDIYRQYNMDTMVLVASVRHPLHVVEAARLGAHAVTLPPAVLDKMVRHPLTDTGLKAFLDDWAKIK